MSSNVSPSSDLFACESRRVKVLLPLPLAGTYDYRVPPGVDVSEGDFVLVPLSKRKMTGVVWGEATENDYDISKLKDIEKRLPIPPLPFDNRQFIDWIAAYTMAAPGAVLKMAMSVRDAFDPPKTQTIFSLADPLPTIKITKARQQVLDFMKSNPPMSAASLSKLVGVSSSVIKGLSDSAALISTTVKTNQYWPQPDPNIEGPALSSAQSFAAQAMQDAVKAASFSVSVLDGVTGSGKTEVYFEAIKECLKMGKQALVLLPEISLSSQWLSRFKERFGSDPGLWHSDLTSAKRRDTWRAVSEGKISILVGARSAIHLPFTDLGLIIVDEEHEQAFKQEEGVIYHARDMAVVRAQISKCPLVLVSATPSLETMVNVETGRYQHLHLPNRHGNASLPTINIVDLRRDKPGRQQWISPTLKLAVKNTLEAGEQALLFLNRRGYAPLTLCDKCGHRMQCPHCTAWLVEHRYSKRLECHHCGYNCRSPEHCPECDETESFRACGPGVERLAEEALSLFPEARMEMVTSDTLSGPIAAAAFVDRVLTLETNLIIGTQIVAKGYHFPMLTLVGVVDADLGLLGGDLRATERTFQLLHQVAGRAGRVDHPGHVYIQTSNPETPVIDALSRHDRDGFLEAEIIQRETLNAPPFGRWAALIISGANIHQVDDVANQLGRNAPYGEGFQTLGPVEAPLAMLRGKHRRRLLLKCDKNLSPQKVIKSWLKKVKAPSTVRITIDIDPYSFM